MMRQAQRWIVVSAAVLSQAAVCLGQSAPAKKSHMFHGKVEAVNAATIKVNGDRVEGWMEAMTMDYKVDDSAILKEAESGRPDHGDGLRWRPCPPQSTGHA
jgi:hypothetical protein